jgi:N-acylneuraminate cytidylyltransferase
MRLAIIPARGGSKRIPRKNIRPFRGQPIIAWPLKAARQSGLFDEVMVSTDDEQIAEVARSMGANVPFMRSPDTSNDTATTAAVLLEVLAKYAEQGATFEVACCMYATAPFVTADLLRDGHDALVQSKFDVIMPVAAFSYPIWRSLKRDGAGRVDLIWPENLNQRSQDLPKAYHDVGQFYWFRTQPFIRDGALMGPNTGSILLPESQVQDIDTEDDWAIAELKHERLYRPT